MSIYVHSASRIGIINTFDKKEGVKFINLYMRVSLYAFFSDVSDGAFNIEILYMSIVIEFYESGTL